MAKGKARRRPAPKRTRKRRRSNTPPRNRPEEQVIEEPRQLRRLVRRGRKEQRAGILFPVTRTHRMMKRLCYPYKVSETGAVYLAAVGAYLIAELFEISRNAKMEFFKQGHGLITPAHIDAAIRSDLEVNELLKTTTIPGSLRVDFAEEARRRYAERELDS